MAPGEIVGLAGLVGAGRSELLEALFGLTGPPVWSRSTEVAFKHPRQSIRNGVAFVPADRKLHGLVLEMSVRENLVMASTSGSRGRVVRRPAGAADRALLVRRNAHPRALVAGAGGRPRAAISRRSCSGSGLRPTRGPDARRADPRVDVGAKREIYRLLFDVAQSGVGISFPRPRTRSC